jgi:WD40 repeat protein
VTACAFTPDGDRIVSGSADQTLRVWDAESGDTLALLPLPGSLTAVAVHPWLPRAVCGDKGGGIYRVGLVGLRYGPIVVTAADRGHGQLIRCPACWQEDSLGLDGLGSELTCLTAGCGLHLRVNPFVLSPAPEGPVASS